MHTVVQIMFGESLPGLVVLVAWLLRRRDV
jgi:hypothetical protein